MARSRQVPSSATGGRRAAPSDADVALADRLHSAAIHLLRRLRAEDDASGLTAPRLSALSVIVFRGPLTLGELAAAEQVQPPTISRLVRELEREGLVRRTGDVTDRRIHRVEATAAGASLLHAGRRRRVAVLAESLRALAPAERRQLESATAVLERVVRITPTKPAS
jgi:DNA-binding MarR family transcriptional regulator